MPFHRHVHRWLGAYARQVVSRLAEPAGGGPRHVLFAVCDHYEPLWGDAGPAVGRERVERWVEDYGRARRIDRESADVKARIKGYTGLSEFSHSVICQKQRDAAFPSET